MNIVKSKVLFTILEVKELLTTIEEEKEKEEQLASELKKLASLLITVNL